MCILVASVTQVTSAGAVVQQPGATPQLFLRGDSLFKARCAACHGAAVLRAPDRARLAALGRPEILNGLNNGTMRPMSEGLTDLQLYAIATFLSPPAKEAAPPVDPPPCAGSPPFVVRPGDWPRWGRNLANWREQPDPGFTAVATPTLKVKWAFAYYGAQYGQPTVAGGRVFLISQRGNAYALDAATGCVVWRYDGPHSRTGIAVGALTGSPSGFAAFWGGAHNMVYAVDAVDGKLIWKQSVQAHSLGILTGAPVLYRDRLYVPLSSYEELTASAGMYSCCTFRGGVVAVDASTGAILWTAYTISRAPAPSHKNAWGGQMYGPAGGAVWSAPTVDTARGVLYVASGDSYTDVKDDGSDAIVAIDLATGVVKWRTQVTPDDNYLSGCELRALVNCPTSLGHDFDFGAPPILVPLSNGTDILVAGQKSGAVYGLNPDSGRVVWKTQVGTGGSLGGVEWGMASDGTRVYVANADAYMPSPPGRPGLAALDPATGRELWFTPSPPLTCGWTGGAACLHGVSAPPMVIPGMVLAGDLNGRLRAYSAETGKVVWEFDTGGQTYGTINGVPAQAGGPIDAAGPVVAEGMLYVLSGRLGFHGGLPTNALLAFSVDAY